MQDVGIATSRPVEVSRPEGSSTVYLTFRGTRDARSAVDRDTRLRIALASVQAAVRVRDPGRCGLARDREEHNCGPGRQANGA